MAQPLPVATTAIGIDVGIARFATLSDGSFIASLNSFRKHYQRLARYQRRMSRKVRFSNNWKKDKARVQKVHTDIALARKDFLHKTTTTISKNHALVCIEGLQSGGRRPRWEWMSTVVLIPGAHGSASASSQGVNI